MIRSGRTAEVHKITVAEVGASAPIWPTFVAEEKGFYGEAGLKPSVVYVGSVAASVQQLVGGSVDLASTTFDTALRAAASGADIRLVGSVLLKYPYSVMVDPSVKTVSDLKGKTVNLSFQKDITTVVWNRWLRENGIDPAEVDQVYDGATPNRFAALSSHSVQAATLTQPFDFRAAQDGYRKLLNFGDYMKGFAFTAVVARGDWLPKNADVTRSYLKAQARAIDWIYDPANKAEAIEILARNTKQAPELAAKTYEYYVNELRPFSRNLAVPPGTIETEAKAMVEVGDLKAASAVPGTLLDLAYLPQ